MKSTRVHISAISVISKITKSCPPTGACYILNTIRSEMCATSLGDECLQNELLKAVLQFQGS